MMQHQQEKEGEKSLEMLVKTQYAYNFVRWQWHVKSQIETDDLGIALVEPKGITWRVLWFTIDTYATEGKHGIITTKDGKVYKFPLNTARQAELGEEIQRRIGAG
jgi:hypothetical protein